MKGCIDYETESIYQKIFPIIKLKFINEKKCKKSSIELDLI